MGSVMKRLGADIARAEDRLLESFDLVGQRKRLLEYGARKKRLPAVRYQLVAVLLAATLVLSLSGYFFRPAVITFRVGRESGREGTWIAAPKKEPLAVGFSDGSELVLERGSRLRVTDLAPNGARVLLERGKARVSVIHQQHTRWRVDVGPFVVHVVGTQFDVSWDPTEERFDLVLREGQVRIAGPTLREERVVSAGEHMEITLGDRPANAATPSRVMDPVEAPSSATLPPSLSVQLVAPARSEPSWRDIAQKGDHRAAYRAVEREGFTVILHRASASDLVLLADVARFSNHPSEAVAALRELARRFPDRPEVADCAFLIGRIFADQRSLPHEAIQWFSRYLAESPDGKFAQEAAGRLIESHQRSGDSAGARAAAERYLAAYPEGPHALFARHALATSGEWRSSGDP
jgi:hypothetical protein